MDPLNKGKPKRGKRTKPQDQPDDPAAPPVDPIPDPHNQALDVQLIDVKLIDRNGYNPNVFTKAQQQKCNTEVGRIGRLPKPLVVRPEGTRYTIVDGEHGLIAAKANGFTQVPCEVVEVDNFEAMRQTYKRNRHFSLIPTAHAARLLPL